MGIIYASIINRINYLSENVLCSKTPNNFIIRTYFYGQNVQNHKDKIVTFSFPKFVFFQDKKITNNQGRFFKEKKAVP